MPLSNRPPTGTSPLAPLARCAVAAIAVLLPPLLSGCAEAPVVWDDARSVATDATAGEPSPATPRAPWRAAPGDTRGMACEASVRYARVARNAAGDTRWYVVWWSARTDGSAGLMIAHSDDEGERWTSPAAVDTVDQSRLGCSRPPPAIAADARSGYVHLAYFMNAPEGAGIFFAHSMDAGETFHTPVAVIYGDRPSAVSVAASGDTVAVAYLDPNALRPHVALALSYTAGHIFERHGLVVSRSGTAAEEPSVTLRGRDIDVGWKTRPPGTSAPAERGRASARHGTLR